jgi:hypothetical protein
MFTSVAAPPLATGTTTVPQPSSVVYPLGRVQPVSEIMDQLNQLKCVVSDLKLGFSDLKISNNEMRHEVNGYRKKPKKNNGLCMQGTILVVVVLIICVVLGSYLTGGLSKNRVRQVVVYLWVRPLCSAL